MVGRFLNDEQALATMRERIREELPSLFNLFRADAYLLKKIVASAGSLLEEVRADPDHPMRQEFDRFVHGFIDRLRNSREYAKRVEKMKRDLLARPELSELAQDVWRSMRAFIEQDAKADDSGDPPASGIDVRRCRPAPRHRSANTRRHERGLRSGLSSFVETQKTGVSTFIADQVNARDLGQLTRLIEINIGRDLQYIRFNGMC